MKKIDQIEDERAKNRRAGSVFIHELALHDPVRNQNGCATEPPSYAT
jgi:hypothetical protein